MKRKNVQERQYERYVRSLSYGRLPGIRSSVVRYPREVYAELYRLEGGKLILDENWKPSKPSTKTWLKNLLSPTKKHTYY
jgi:hypothetical protein